MKQLDPYGYKKLECENYLCVTFANLTSLRLPDVIGPFDETQRLQKYVAWFTFDQIKAPIGYEDKDLNRKLSFVYSEDVVKVILKVLDQPAETGLRIWNLACKEQIFLKDFLETLQ